MISCCIRTSMMPCDCSVEVPPQQPDLRLPGDLPVLSSVARLLQSPAAVQ
jgi:hypothetical protein|eukprot:COSAG01_NODE_1522_length_10022_cov_81.163761_5_plen_50_part_00